MQTSDKLDLFLVGWMAVISAYYDDDDDDEEGTIYLCHKYVRSSKQ